MVSRHWGALIGLISTASLVFVACGSDDPAPPANTAGTSAAGTNGGAGTTSTAGSGGANGGSAGADTEPAGACLTAADCEPKFKTKTPAIPPAPPAGGAAAAGEDLVHGLSKLYVGDTDRDGNVSDQAWKKFGFDIDGWDSTPAQGFHCKPIGDAKKADIRQDGENGIDNSFGKNIVNGILATLIANPSDKITESITGGSFSVILKMEKAGTVSGSTETTGILTQLYAAAGTKDGDKYVAPGDDWSNYEWHPFGEILDADGKSSKVKFASSYINKGVWVSGGKGTVNLQLAISGYNLNLDINQAQLEVDISAGTTGTNGTIGGVLQTTQLVSSLQKIAGNLDTKFCDPNSPALVGILDGVRGASDILQDGTQDAAKDCDAISVGLGFDSKKTKLGDKAPDGGASADPCAQ